MVDTGGRRLIIPDANFAVIGTGSIEAFREIQDFLLMLPSFKIVFIKVDLNRLYITKKKPVDEIHQGDV